MKSIHCDPDSFKQLLSTMHVGTVRVYQRNIYICFLLAVSYRCGGNIRTLWVRLDLLSDGTSIVSKFKKCDMLTDLGNKKLEGIWQHSSTQDYLNSAIFFGSPMCFCVKLNRAEVKNLTGPLQEVYFPPFCCWYALGQCPVASSNFCQASTGAQMALHSPAKASDRYGNSFFPSITASCSGPEATNSPKPRWPSSIHLGFVRGISCQWPCGTSKCSFVNFRHAEMFYFLFYLFWSALRASPPCNCKCEIWLQENSKLRKKSLDCLHEKLFMQCYWIFCITRQFSSWVSDFHTRWNAQRQDESLRVWHEWPLRWLDLMTDLTLHVMKRSEQMIWITCLVLFCWVLQLDSYWSWTFIV